MNFAQDEFLKELKTRKDYVDDCLQRCLEKVDTYPPVIHEAMHYAVFNGGKRLRPILVLEGARLARGKVESVVPTACAMEMIHSYSLVHDDLPAMDDDDLRRGKPTCHKVYGEAIAILTGDALLTAAFELMAKNAEIKEVSAANVVRVITAVSQAAGSRGMIGGQIVDLASEGKQIDYATLKTLHSLKTGELFKVSLLAGAMLYNMDGKSLDSLKEFAYHFGLAFQITDDILDVKGDQQLTGKPVGSDEKNAKTTYPSLFGLEKSWSLAEDSVKACIESLSSFGSEADFLRNLAYFTLYRKA